MSATALLVQHFKSWIGARGFFMVVAAALVPLVLTGAWVGTHQRDITATAVSWEPDPAIEGSSVNITGVIRNKARFDTGAFNATIQVGRVSGTRLILDSENRTRIDNLAGGEERTLRMTWTPTPGYFVVNVEVDRENVVPEIEEFNNQRLDWIEVHYRDPDRTLGPKAPTNLTGGGPATDIVVTGITWDNDEPAPGEAVNYTAYIENRGGASITNASVTFRVGQVFGDQLFQNEGTQQNLDLAAGENKTVQFQWPSAAPGVFWVEAFVNTTGGASESNVTNNHLAQPYLVHLIVPPEARFPEPEEERITIKQFYLDIISILHIRILLPFIGLFYAAGVLADDKDRGNLTYILTRPVPRWIIPLAKFIAGFLVAAAAVVIGILVTFFLLLGTPQGNVGFLTTPLFVSLISLFVYGSFFILLGVLVERPYLIGIAFVIGWETIAGNFVPWVRNLTLGNHLLNMIVGAEDNPENAESMTDGWRLDQGLQWLPEGDVALDALRNMVIAAFVFLALAAFMMQRREFDV